MLSNRLTERIVTNCCNFSIVLIFYQRIYQYWEEQQMISRVSTVSVYVSDQQRAKAFYTDKLGMELRQDAELFPGASNRWIAVAPKGSETEIILYLPDENWEHYKQVVGKSQ